MNANIKLIDKRLKEREKISLTFSCEGTADIRNRLYASSVVYKAYEKTDRKVSLKLNEKLSCVNFIKKDEYIKCVQTKIEALDRILIVDDDAVILNVLKDIFNKRGYHVTLCSNSFEVNEKIKENKIDIAIIDLILPEIDGIEIVESIRKTEPELPIIMLSGSADTGNKIRALGIGADDYITKPFEEKELVARVERALTRASIFRAACIEDGLTEAYTKNYLWRKIKEYMCAYQRNKKAFSIAFIDMDNFKNINDTYGHLIGDEALKCFVYALKASLRLTDYVFRFGGDEFVVLFPETDEKNAYNNLERFRNNFAHDRIKKNSTSIVFDGTFSAGITEVKGTDVEVEDIIRRADMALYEAKAQGKNRTCIYLSIT